MRVLIIGDHEHREFAAVVQWLQGRTQVALAASFEQALAVLCASDAPGLVIIAQSRPGQISARDVEQVHAAAPLARLIALLGTWCEGETRSGRPWPGVPRMYWHEALPRLALLLERTGIAASWSLPRTATDAEWLLAGAPIRSRKNRGVAAVSARRHSTFAALAEVCDAAGLAAVWHSPERPAAVQGITLGLWDSAGWGPFESHELAKFAATLGPAHVIALVDFPRLAERDQILAAGAKAVVPKPFLLDDLLWQIDNLLGVQAPATLVEAA